MSDYYTVKRTRPKNDLEIDKSLFEHELIRRFKKTEQLDLKKCIIDSSGTFITTNKLSRQIADTSNVYLQDSYNILLLILKKIVFLNFRIVIKKTIWFTDGWSNGYFHWMLDALPRLFTAIQNQPSTKVILPHQFKNQDYISASLKALGVNDIQFMKPNTYYWFRRILFQTHLAPTGNYHDETVRHMRDRLLENLPLNNSTKGERIYISRAKAKRRRVINEHELIPILKKHQFSIIHFEDYNWAEQMAFCANAKIMIGLHGAGLTNMLFMNKNTKVLELRRENDAHNNCYFALASALNIQYYYQLCKTNSEDTLHADFEVDKLNFKSNLEFIANF